jgi:MerR family transcriptional regulator, copper efflux regulator
MENELPKLISIKKAAEIIGVTPLTLRNWDRDGKLKALRHPINNYRVYKRQDIEKFIANISESSGRPPSILAPKPKENLGPKKLDVRHEEE